MDQEMTSKPAPTAPPAAPPAPVTAPRETDPDATLTRVRTMARAILEAVTRGDQSIPPDTALGLAVAVLTLDQSLSLDGQLPSAWQPQDVPINGTRYAIS